MADLNKVLHARYPEARKDRASRKNVPESLLGCWIAPTTHSMELTPTGRRYNIDGLKPFSISADGSELTWDGFIWTRVSGSGETLTGVWRYVEAEFTEEVQFNADSTYLNWYVEVEEVYPGTYAVSGNQVAVRELSQTYSATDTTITFQPLYSPAYTVTYTASETELHLTFGDGERADYIRGAC